MANNRAPQQRQGNKKDKSLQLPINVVNSSDFILSLLSEKSTALPDMHALLFPGASSAVAPGRLPTGDRQDPFSLLHLSRWRSGPWQGKHISLFFSLVLLKTLGSAVKRPMPPRGARPEEMQMPPAAHSHKKTNTGHLNLVKNSRQTWGEGGKTAKRGHSICRCRDSNAVSCT